MKKKIVVTGIFFLTLFISSPAVAAETSIQAVSDFQVTQVGSFDKATAFSFGPDNTYIVAVNNGGSSQVLKVKSDGTSESLLDRTGATINAISYYQGLVYLVTRGQIYKITKGKISDVVTSLPVSGDFGNSPLVFDGNSMYFAIGTATNSGVVGPDNQWLASYPAFHDISCGNVKLSGLNIETDNFLTKLKNDKVNLGSLVPFNTQVSPNEIINGMNKCSGAILKASLDGSNLGVYAWGLHNPKGISIDDQGKIWLFDGGMEDRGVRPVKNAKDVLYAINEHIWYGWPDFNAGKQIDGQPILAEFPDTPPSPNLTFDLNQIKYLVVAPNAFLSNQAVAQVGEDKLSSINLSGGSLQNLLTVNNGKIIQYKFGPDDKLYVLVGNGNKTLLYSVGQTHPTLSGALGSKAGTATKTNWLLGLLIALIVGFGFYIGWNTNQKGFPPAGA